MVLMHSPLTTVLSTTMCFPYFSAGAALILHAFFAAPAFAASTNITVDDTDSTVWTFVGTWSAVTPATPCPGCFAQPDPKLVYNSTWHDGTLVSGSCTFQGSAIYIYGIDMTATSGTNISFSMNNPPTAGFHYFGDTGTTYNVPFFSATNLDSSVEHTVTFIGETTLAGAGAMLFDYAYYTTIASQYCTTITSQYCTTIAIQYCTIIEFQVENPSCFIMALTNIGGQSIAIAIFEPQPHTNTHDTHVQNRPDPPVILALDPNPTRARDSEVEARLRHLEALAQPPQYQ
ncbi:hypothetical protein B0H11DRAFT_2291837 [Mycena galericulata]|nr:hypothetical protein B0H11DRAFT_2291837 [Mycena galericulata]